jgi:hypothetical protein
MKKGVLDDYITNRMTKPNRVFFPVKAIREAKAIHEAIIEESLKTLQ